MKGQAWQVCKALREEHRVRSCKDAWENVETQACCGLAVAVFLACSGAYHDVCVRMRGG